MTYMQGGFSGYQYQAPLFLQSDVGGAHDEVVGIGVYYARQGFHGAGENHHTVCRVGAAADGGGQVVIGVHTVCEFGNRFGLPLRFQRDIEFRPIADNEVRFHLR